MHVEAMDFLVRTAELPHFERLAELRVLELGSYNVNGSAREVFGEAKEYVGIDVRSGPGVDLVANAEEYIAPVPFDVVISTESLEHTPFPEFVIEAAWANLVAGGLLVLTAAAPPRIPHGCDGTVQLPIGEYYSNIAPDYLRLLLTGWDIIELTYDTAHGDVYAVAQKPAAQPEPAALPDLVPAPVKKKSSK